MLTVAKNMWLLGLELPETGLDEITWWDMDISSIAWKAIADLATTVTQESLGLQTYADGLKLLKSLSLKKIDILLATCSRPIGMHLLPLPLFLGEVKQTTTIFCSSWWHIVLLAVLVLVLESTETSLDPDSSLWLWTVSWIVHMLECCTHLRSVLLATATASQISFWLWTWSITR